jgi:amidophosphoribosyltransferase
MCGVAGVLGSQKASLDVYLGLSILQHRGQDAAGICSFDSSIEPSLHVQRALGLVNQAIPSESLDHLTGNIAIGHTRYATVGKKGDVRNIQPMVTNFPVPLAMCHNGNLVNYFELKKELQEADQFSPLTGSDLEVIMRVFNRSLLSLISSGRRIVDFDQIFESSLSTMKKCIGAYSVIGMISDEYLFGFCDPHGIRPLVFGRKKDSDGRFQYAFASEDNVLNFLGFEALFSVTPGECVIVNSQGLVERKVLLKKELKACMFEWVYFAGAESKIWDLPVYSARLELGRQLGLQVKDQLLNKGHRIDFVSPVPDTSRTSAIALAEVLNLPYRETLIKNRYVQRSFIMNRASDRSRAVELKLSPIRGEIEGKSILLVDDSIVRGTTLRRIIQMVRSVGAKKVYVATTCPPIRYGCFYGIDFPDPNQLVAKNREVSEVERELGADGIVYLTLDGLKKSINSQDNLCLGCLTGDYPTGDISALSFKEKRNAQGEG